MTVETDHAPLAGTAPETLRAMAAIVRTVFGVALQPPSVDSAPVAVPVVETPAPAAVPLPRAEAVAPATVAAVVLPVQSFAETSAPPFEDALTVVSWEPSIVAPVGVAVPGIPLPEAVPVVSERHSLALLQEIAFLDD